MRLLQVEPEQSVHAGQTREASGHVWSDRGTAGEDSVQGLAANVQLACGLDDRKPEVRQHAVAQHRARMDRLRLRRLHTLRLLCSSFHL
ncbi:hypothetical protein MGN01_40120 [Methylobacterium gnaphalii]|uniref:Uncharacterized protein n=1 Tax=Methylobacterium gnaphalii TaxID=1010610 RepID=A0A512JQD3_9HYPH|nr:hypothetical protein MGN01_40120 [Methylobacterium gnaphalii]GLS48838.1 hypothetical protein GCM10007885_16850 [Methylobacterium gnaphalii]